MNRKLIGLLAVLAAGFAVQNASAAILYSENFNTDNTANWTVNNAGAGTDTLADFYYDYSGIGVPAAPGGGNTTRGLKMTANNTAGVFGGFSVSPTGESFSGEYRLRFSLWQNYAGPLGPGGNGTTQLSTFGVGTSGTTNFWPGAAVKDSIAFGATLDGGATADYRAYSPAPAGATSYPSGNAVYQAPGGAINESNAYYTSAFPAQSAPAAQLSLFPGQTGSTNPGEISFKWRTVFIDVMDGNATWSVDGVKIAVVPLSEDGITGGVGNILFGHSDTNAAASTDANDTLLNITLIDNITVLTVPEPTSLGLLSLCAVGLLGRSRRAV